MSKLLSHSGAHTEAVHLVDTGAAAQLRGL